MLYPLLQVPHREQYAFGLCPGSVPLLPEAIGDGFLRRRFPAEIWGCLTFLEL